MKATIEIPLTIRIAGLRVPSTRKYTAQIPASWSEVRPHHILPLAAWMHEVARLGEWRPSTFATTLCRWMGIPEIYAPIIADVHSETLAQIATPFVATVAHPKPAMHRFLWLSGPGKNLKRMAYGQFVTAETILRAYTSTGEFDYLRALAALSFTPPAVKWSRSLASFRAKWMKAAPRKYVAMMAYTYIGQRNNLPAMYPELYDHSKKASGPELRIDQQILAMCGHELGGYRSVDAAPVHTVLELMQLKEITNRKNNPNYARRHLDLEKLHEVARRNSREHNAQRGK